MGNRSQIPRRRLGKTEELVSLISVGGHHIGRESVSDDEAISLIRAAIDAGLNFLDNHSNYHHGRSEELMGCALKGGYRERVCLMTKFDSRDKKSALEELDRSLKRMQTDYLDIWQIHAIGRESDPDLISAPGGALEALDEAKASGKARFVGFTGHKDPKIHLDTVDLYDFDTVQLPLNVMDAHYKSFQQHVLPFLMDRDIGIIAMKSFGDGDVLESGTVTPEEALRYTLSLPISTLVKGMESMEELNWTLNVVRGFVPLGEEEMSRILAKTASPDIAGSGQFEVYKEKMEH